MPTYEYRCEKCGKTFEYFQSMKDAPLSACLKETCREPAWGQGKVKRLFGTGSGIIFKGSGFYATDYRKGTPPAAEKTGASTAEQTGAPAAPQKSE